MDTPSQPAKPSLRWHDGEPIRYNDEKTGEKKVLVVKTGERHSVSMSDGTKHHLLVRVPNDGSTRQQRRAAARGKA